MQRGVGQNKDNCESNFCDGRAPGRASWPRVPPRASALLTWHPGELRHATRIACHRARAQTTRQPSPAADARLSTTAKCLCSLRGSPWQCSHPSERIRRTLLHVLRASIASADSLHAHGSLWRLHKLRRLRAVRRMPRGAAQRCGVRGGFGWWARRRCLLAWADHT